MTDHRPDRGFPPAEYQARTERIQRAMYAAKLDAVVVTSPPNFYYFSGFATEFWQSPTRPWFLVLPADGPPIAVVPEIGAPALQQTWVDDIRSWPAPRPDDDGLSDLASVFDQLAGQFGRIGWEMGRESHLRMPVVDFDRLREITDRFAFADASPEIWSIRMVKSPAEIDRIRTICQTASDAFEAMPNALSMGDSERVAANKLRAELTRLQVDAIPFVAACSGHGGPSQIIMGSTERQMGDGDILFMDLGATWDGYFCDFDRNFGFGAVGDDALAAHDTVWRATEAGIEAARPGTTTDDLFHAMAAVLEAGGATDLNVGRLGHGLGLQLTEPPSNRPGDMTPLQPGMVITIEPGLEYAPGKMIVHEENVVITEDGCQLLTRRASRELPIIDG